MSGKETVNMEMLKQEKVDYPEILNSVKSMISKFQVESEYEDKDKRAKIKVNLEFYPEWVDLLKLEEIKKNRELLYLKICLYKQDKRLSEQNILVDKVYLEYNQEFLIENPDLWDSEHPCCYAISLEDWDNGMADMESTMIICKKLIGIRTIEIMKNEVLWNGMKLKLRGICYKERRRETELNNQLKEELITLKQANINYLRVLYKPASEELLELCDQMGFYVEEGPGITGVGQELPPTQDLPHLKSEYLNKFSKMIERDKHHPSILIWSLGDRSTWGSNFKAEYEYAKQFDPGRPVVFHLPMTIPEEEKGTDIWPCHYVDYRLPLNVCYDHMDIGHTHGADNPIGYATGEDCYQCMPVLHDEFARIPSDNRDEIKQDPGIHEFYGESIKRYADIMYQTNGCLGGAIFAAFDEIELEDGIEYCNQWGIIDLKGVKKPEYYHVKKSYSPIRIEDLKAEYRQNKFGEDILVIEIENRYNHTNLNELKIIYQIATEDFIREGNWEQLKDFKNILPREKGMLCFPIPKEVETVYGDKKLWIRVEDSIQIVDESCILLKGKNILGKAPLLQKPLIQEQLKQDLLKQNLLNQNKDILNQHQEILPPNLSILKLSETKTTILISGEDFSVEFSKETGLIQNVSKNGTRIIKGGPYLQMTGLKLGDWKCQKISAVKQEDNKSISVEIQGWYGKICEVLFTLIIDRQGVITTFYEILNLNAAMPHTVKVKSGMDCGGLKELGISYLLEEDYQNLSWKRKGLWSVYEPQHIGRNEGSTSLYLSFNGKEIKENNISKDKEELYPENCKNYAGQCIDYGLYGPYDISYKGCNDFRSMKHHILEAQVVNADKYGIHISSDGKDSICLIREPDKEAMIDDRNSNIFYYGNWYEVDDYCGCIDDTESVSDSPGDYAEYEFEGTGIIWYASSDMVNGMADVYLDGKLMASDVSLYPAKPEFPGMSRGYEKRYQTIGYAVEGLTYGIHKIKILVTGKKQSKAQGTYVSIDAFQVLGRKECGSIRVILNQSFNYTRLIWGNYKNPKVTAEKGTKNQVTFKLL